MFSSTNQQKEGGTVTGGADKLLHILTLFLPLFKIMSNMGEITHQKCHSKLFGALQSGNLVLICVYRSKKHIFVKVKAIFLHHQCVFNPFTPKLQASNPPISTWSVAADAFAAEEQFRCVEISMASL